MLLDIYIIYKTIANVVVEKRMHIKIRNGLKLSR